VRNPLTDTPLGMAEECLGESEGDWKLAHEIGMRRFEKNPDLLVRMLTDHASEIFWGYIRRVARGQRNMGPVTSPNGSGVAKKGQRRMGIRNLLAFPLTGGKPLARATRPDLIAQAGLYRNMASANLQRDRWFTLVAAQLPDDQKQVIDALTNEKLNELWVESQDGS